MVAKGKPPPGIYEVQVVGATSATFPVAEDGSVSVNVPVLPRRCSLVCFGLTLFDGSPRTRKTIKVLRNGDVVRKMSLRDLTAIAPDPSGALRIEL